MITKIARIIGWAMGGIVGLAMLLYLIVVAINWRDKEPSAAALRFESIYKDRPAIADSDNAYIFMMGFGVAPTEDPFAIGLKRKEWLTIAKHEVQLNLKDDPHPNSYDYKSNRTPETTKLLEHCVPGKQTCAVEFDKSDAVLQDWLLMDGWLLERYQTLLKFPAWLEPASYDVSEPLPAYAGVMDGQRLLLARAKVLARKNDVRGVRTLLEQDIRFWRMMLRSSDLLISKMIATAALNRHFELSNVILRQLSPTDAVQAMPNEWQTPISSTERSMLTVFGGEWMYSSRMLKTLMARKTIKYEYEAEEDPDLSGKLTDALALPLFQYQDTTNKTAEYLLSVAQAFDVPLDQYPQAMRKAATIKDNALEATAMRKSVYNVVGNTLFGVSMSTYLPYIMRVADIEGTRRAALAAVVLRQNGVKTDSVATELESLDLRNPYDHKPFEWDQASGSIIFSGMEEGERRVHRFLY
jgi:hypothetical protein